MTMHPSMYPQDRAAVGDRVKVRGDIMHFAGWEGLVVMDDGTFGCPYKVDFGGDTGWHWFAGHELVVLDG
jgi:hypothetical protein